MSIPNFTVRRVHLNSGGYDSNGRYFGRDVPLWLVESWYNKPTYEWDSRSQSYQDAGSIPYSRDSYVRAYSKEDAKIKHHKEHPNDVSCIEDCRSVHRLYRKGNPAPRLTKDGYTKRHGSPTPFMVMHENRERRVYVWQFSNCGTLFVKINGKSVILTKPTVEV